MSTTYIVRNPFFTVAGKTCKSLQIKPENGVKQLQQEASLLTAQNETKTKSHYHVVQGVQDDLVHHRRSHHQTRPHDGQS